MMRPFAGFLFLISLSVVLVACGQTTSPPPQAPPTPLPAEAPQTPPSPAPAPPTAPAPTVQPATEAAAAPVDANKGKTLLETECVKCHNIERVTGFSENISWKEIVDRMITKHGAKISTEDAAIITDHLDKTLPRK